MNENSVNNHLAKLLYKNRLKIILCCLAFAIFSGVITTFIPKKYEASGTIYSTKSNNIKDEAKDPNFGLELEASKLTQLFNSEAMFDHIVANYDLINYYELDTTSSTWYDKLRRKYYKEISVVRNEYLSLTVSAVMKDAQLAADIVNDMMLYIDTVRSDLYLQNTKRLIISLESKILHQESKVDSLLLVMFNNEQSGLKSVINDNHIAQIKEHKSQGVIQLGDGLIGERLASHFTPELEKQITEYYYELGILNNYKTYYSEAVEKVELPFPNVYSVSKAQVNNKKTNLPLTANIMLGFIFGLVVSISLILFMNKWKDFKENLT